MKKIVFLLGCVSVLTVACKTTHLRSVVESRASSVEMATEAKVDSVKEQACDSVFVFVEKADSMTRVLEKVVRVRERVKVVKDTILVVEHKTDTVWNDVRVVEDVKVRSPTQWRLRLRNVIMQLALLAAVLLIVKLLLKKGV